MKAKKIATMCVSLGFVATVGVGATLAYLTSTTETLQNTFTVGAGIEADLTEIIEKVQNEDGSVEEITDDDGYAYNDIQPGDILIKEPYMTIKNDSSDCYAFMRVTGIDALEEQDFLVEGFDTNAWVKIADADMERNGDDTYVNTPEAKDGIYAFVGKTGAEDVTNAIIEKAAEDVRLASLFATVTYDENITEENTTDLSDIIIVGCAVQARGFEGYLDASAAAVFE